MRNLFISVPERAAFVDCPLTFPALVALPALVANGSNKCSLTPLRRQKFFPS
jgi:hypothetical protein